MREPTGEGRPFSQLSTEELRDIATGNYGAITVEHAIPDEEGIGRAIAAGYLRSPQ